MRSPFLCLARNAFESTSVQCRAVVATLVGLFLLVMGAGPSAAQSITSLQPKSGAAGTQVRIHGSGFDATASNNTVTFGGTTASIDSAKTNVLYAQVPSGVSGPVPVEVTTGGTTATGAGRFMAVSGGGDTFADIEADLTGVGSVGASVAWGDYDSDGDMDLVVAGETEAETPTTTIYRNDENGNFRDIGADIRGVKNASVAWGDFDADGELDLAVAGEDEEGAPTTSIYRNEGGSFVAIGADLTGLSSSSVAWGDYDSDGDLDLAVAGADTDFNPVTKIYQNKGGGTFAALNAELTGVRGASIAWGDYNSDGELDLAIAGDDGDRPVTTIYRNEGSGSFTPLDAGLTGADRGAVAWGDYDGDGRLDLAVAGDDGDGQTTAIYRNGGGGDFTAIGASITGVGFGASIAWGDYNGDGKLDLTISGDENGCCSNGGQITEMYRNEGGGNFTAIDAGLPGVSVAASAWGDFDGDGGLDLAVVGSDKDFDEIANVYRNKWKNFPPVARKDTFSIRGKSGGTAAPGVLKNDDDPGDDLTASLVSDVSHGSLTFNSDGSFKYTPNSGFSGTDSFTYEVVDESGATDEAAVTLQVTPLTVSSIQPESGAEGTPVRIHGFGFDADPSNNTVTFGGVEAAVDSAKTNVLYAQVPSSVSGPVPVKVTTGGMTGTAASRFLAVAGGGASFGDIGAGLTGVGDEGAVAWGDFDGDGDLDLAVAGLNQGNEEIAKIYRNEGGDTFTDIGAGLTGVEDASVAWGDYDGDGDLDLALAGWNGDAETTKIYRNEGNGTFTDIGAGLSGVESGTLAWGDYNEDGNLDLAVVGNGSGSAEVAKIYRNEGDGRFTNIGAELAEVSFASVAWADYNGDGRLDLALAGRDGFQSFITLIYRNEGDGSFTMIDAELPGVGGTVAWRDYNRDGKPDLAVAGSDTTKVYRNEGSGSFAAVGAGLPDGGTSLSWGDYDGDGNPDLAVVGSDTSGVYRNEGNESFTVTDARFAEVGGPVSWGDYDGDGDLDLVVAGEDDGAETTKIFQNEGNRPPVAQADSFWTVRGQPISVAAPGVLKNDSDPDKNSISVSLASDVSNGALTLNGDGSFEYTPNSGFRGIDQFDYEVTDGRTAVEGTATIEVNQALTAFQPKSGAPGTRVRIYGSGFDPTPSNNTVTFGGTEATVESAETNVLSVEIPSGVSGPVPVEVTTGGTTITASDHFVALGEGGGTFADIEAELLGQFNASAEWGDYNGDGNLDFAVVGHSTAAIYRNEGDGSFTRAEDFPFDIGFDGELAWVDYDADGDLDLMLTADTDAFDGVRIYRNEGDGSFKAVDTNLPGMSGSQAWGDYDGDGDPDLVTTDENGSTTIYRNEGNGSFTNTNIKLSGDPVGSGAWGDYDGDGRLDLFVDGEIYRNEGGETFTAIGVNLTGSGPPVWGDYNSDGNLDLALGDNVYRNNGDGTFSSVATNLLGARASSAWGDYDGDGDLDLAVIKSGYAQGSDDLATEIYENEGDDTFTQVNAGLTDVSRGALAWGDYNSDGRLDLLVAGNIGNPNGTLGGSLKVYQNVEGGVSAPSGLTAAATDAPAIDLDWSAVEDQEALLRYRLYRDTAPISGSPSDVSPFDSTEGGTTTFTDEPEPGTTYYYRVTAVDTTGTESGFSGEANAFLYPNEVTASTSRTFDGATDPTSYRLVALPGQVDRSITEAVSGEDGTEWQAYRDDGSDSNFLVEYEDSEPFRFQKGNGFWLTATSEWSFEETLPTADLRGDSATAIAVREGWNVVSNPLDKAVGWAAVNEATGGDLQPIWAFDGAFSEAETFASAATGTAYYFFNDDSERDSLIIPYPGAPGGKTAPKTTSAETPMLALTATPTRVEDASGSTVRLGVAEPREALVAPPGQFETTSLRIEAGESDAERASLLMAEQRPLDGGGETFAVRLQSEANGPVAFTAKNVEALEDQSVVLLHPGAGQTYDLRSDETVTVKPDGETAELKVAIGTESYVESEAEEIVPKEVTLTSYPNPVRQAGTIAYGLPEAQEVTLRVYDVLGRQVATLEQGRKEAGRHTIDLETDRLSSGVYFGRLQTDGQTLTQKITVVR